ncbi:MAG: DUF1566 domain-containing protein, partial [Deltaproteobacteria bacterium]
KYVEHRDDDSYKTGKSRDRTDWLGSVDGYSDSSSPSCSSTSDSVIPYIIVPIIIGLIVVAVLLWKSRPIEPRYDSDYDKAPLTLGGPFNFTIDHKEKNVEFTVGLIENPRSGGRSGSIRVQLYAADHPFDGKSISGVILSDHPLGLLKGGWGYRDTKFTNSLPKDTLEPGKSYYMTLILLEYYQGQYWIVASHKFDQRYAYPKKSLLLWYGFLGLILVILVGGTYYLIRRANIQRKPILDSPVKQSQRNDEDKVVERHKTSEDSRFIFSDLTVLDEKTKLMWTRDANIAEEEMNWHDASKFIESLNKEEYAGYSNWRLPSKDELRTLVEFVKGQGYTEGINEHLNNIGFKNVQPNFYWSSTAAMNNSSDAWFVEFYRGFAYYDSKSSNFRYVRCVRVGQ